MYSDIFLSIAEARGLVDKKKLTSKSEKVKSLEIEKLNDFINLKYDKHIYDGAGIKGIDKAIEILKKAIQTNKKIAIYADYDCDGIPGATILSDFFNKIKYSNYIVYIPHRHNEGYGVHMQAIDKLKAGGVDLMITIDLGITNVREIEYAKSLGLQVILTDHHLPIRGGEGRQIIPPADVVINMKQDDCKYIDKNLCGCATIWKLIQAFIKAHGEAYAVEQGWEKTLLDLVGLSTIADMVPLEGENRALAHFGLKVLNMTKRIGIIRMLQNAKSKGRVDEETIGFTIAPRLNSASRMDDPMLAYKALSDRANGHIFADRLESLNVDRKASVKDSIGDIDKGQLSDKIIVLNDPSWNPGILGLIASRIVEETGHTVFVAGGRDQEGNYKGSVRAGSGEVNVVQLMSEVSHLMLHFGGHEAAGGFKIHESSIGDFRRELNMHHFTKASQITLDNITTDKKSKDIPAITINSEQVSLALYQEMRLLGPFGMGNTAPRFIINESYKVGYFGKSKEHLELKWSGLRAIKFFATAEDVTNTEAGKNPIINLAWDSYRDDIVGRVMGWE